MSELIKRLEKAIGPDRELDNEIARLVYYPIPSDPVGWPPRYTFSIDAALTLLPDEDHHWKAGYSKHVPHNAEVRDLMHPYKGVFVGEHDHSRAIALCIAILKARALRDTTTDGINKLLAELRAEKKARASLAPGQRLEP